MFPLKWSSLIWFVVGGAVSILHFLAPWSTYKRFMPAPESYVEIEGVVTDAMLTGNQSLHWLDPAGKVEISLVRMRLHDGEPWHRCRGKVLLYEKNTMFTYGQRLRVRGAMRVPFQGTLPHQFDQRHYLKLKGIEHCLFPDSTTILSSVDGWRRLPNLLLVVRSHFLETLLKDVPDQTNQALLAAVMFGMKSGLNWSEKDMFRKSGMVHLFAVSGLHVGIIFSLVVLVLNLAQVPFRWRYALAPVVLLLYVGLTGAESSAVRAWVMLSVWSVSRSFYLPGKALNTVMVAALLLLLVNPFNLYHIGFQYSFLLVTAILCGWRLVAMIWSCYSVPMKLIPGRAQGYLRWSYKLRQFVLTTVGAMTVFWLGGFGLTAWYGHMILPMSLVTNIVVGFIAWGIMILGWVKIVLGTCYIPLLPKVAAGVLDLLVGMLRWLAESVSDPQWVLAIGSIPLLLVCAYYLTFIVLVTSPLDVKPLFRRLSVVAVTLVIFVGCCRPPWQGSRVDILKENSSSIPVICIRSNNHVTLVNCGGKTFYFSLLAWLHGEGIDRVDRVILTNGAREYSGSLNTLSNTVELGSVIQVSGRKLRFSELTKWRSYRHLESKPTTEFQWTCRQLSPDTSRCELLLPQDNRPPISIRLITTKHQGAVLTVNGRQYPLDYQNDDQLVDSFLVD